MSITNSPLAAAAEPSGLVDKVVEFVASARMAAADGLTWGEFGELLLALLRLVVTALDTANELSGPQKKTFALDAVARLFDAVADYAVPTVLLPFWILARPAVRSLLLSLAGGLLEQLLPLVRSAR